METETKAQNPYELKRLAVLIKARAKARGLDLAEQAIEELAIATYFGIQEWIQESAMITDSKLDDVVASLISYLDSFVLPQVAKIDLNGDGK